jgi:EAL domain-containing protein (putative c-di-GMP-specific phosphodiesterase class I)
MIEASDRDVAAVMKNADAALDRAKREGGNASHFFSSAMDVELQRRHRLEVELWDALARGEFEAFYQPQFDLRSNTWVGVEALLRWRHPERGYVSPAEFIPVAEEIGLMEALGTFVLHAACAEVARWPGAIKLAVNVSPVQFTRGNLAEEVARALAESGLPPERLELEITESLFLEENGPLRATMDEILARGVSFALDDFGTGYSSLSYLRKFPIGKIKIDRSFVTGLPHDREAVSIIQAVVGLAGDLGIRTNAEGLETPEQIAVLSRLGCMEGQGFAYGKPQAGPDLLRALAAQPLLEAG